MNNMSDVDLTAISATGSMNSSALTRPDPQLDASGMVYAQK
jgi:hypothetical protein